MSVVRMHQETSDLDEAVEAIGLSLAQVGMRVTDPDDDFRYVQDVVAADGIASVYQNYRAKIQAGANEGDTVFVVLTESGNASYRLSGTKLDVDTGILWSGRRGLDVSIMHAEVSCLTVDRADFETRARQLLARPDFVLPDFVPLPSPAHVALARTHHSALRRHHLDEMVASNPLAWRAATDLTIAMVLAATGLDRVRVESARLPLTVRRATTYIDDNLDRPIALADIAAAAGLSARGLQVAFQRFLGETPMARLRRGRLARAHAELVAADPTTGTVAAISQRWGFAHHGRFAQMYSRTFGQSPSATLRS